MLELRPYQSSLISEIYGALKLGYKHIMTYAPQGSGKSVILAYIALGSMKKKNKVLILSHRQEILLQNMRKMEMLGMKVQVVNPHTKSIDPEADCYCGMSQTISSRIVKRKDWADWLLGIDVTVVDEAHRAEHDNVISGLDTEKYIIGLSASILRSGNKTKQLGSFYDCIVSTVSTKELIQSKYLTPSRSYTFQAPKLDNVKISGGTGDYVASQLQNAFNKPERYAGVIENYLRLTPNTKAVAFTTGSEHCVSLCKAFNEAGIKSKYILSNKMPETDIEFSGDRETLLDDFRKGKFQVIVNVSILDTGWDEPSLETVILDFSTKSYAKHAQSTGRGSRLYVGKNHFNVLDFGGNIETHGVYERDSPPMSLWHSIGGGGVMATKECPKDKGGCNRLIPVSATDCPYCSYHFKTEREVYEVELQEYIEDKSDQYTDVDKWIAKCILDGWSNNRILCAICAKNPENQKKSFMDAIKILRTANGSNISPQYWHFFKNNILNKKRK